MNVLLWLAIIAGLSTICLCMALDVGAARPFRGYRGGSPKD